MQPTVELEHSFLRRLGRLCHERPWWIVGALLLSLLPTVWLGYGLKIQSSFLDLLPADEPAVRELNEVATHARSASDIAVAIDATDRALAERFARAFEQEIVREPGVSGVGGHIDRRFFDEHRLLYASDREIVALTTRVRDAIDRQLLRSSGFYVDLEDDSAEETPTDLLAEVERTRNQVPTQEWVVTNDGRYLCVWAFFPGNSGDLAFGRAALARVESVLARLRDGQRFPRELVVKLAGGIPTRVEDERALVSDLRLAGGVGFFAVVLLIVASLRAPRALWLLAIPLLVGLAWTFAFARVAVGHLNIISGFLFSILSGLGIEYGIHLVHRYRELRAEGEGLELAIEHLIAKTGRALLSGAMTNATVFAVIAFARFEGFSEFGLIASVGLLLTLVATLLGLPALLVLTERYKPLHRQSLDQVQQVAKPMHISRYLRRSIGLGVPLLALLSLMILARGEIRFDGNWRLLTGSGETSRFADYLRHHLGGNFTGGLLYVRDRAALDRVVEVVERVRASRTARGVASQIIAVATEYDVLPARGVQVRRIALAQQLSVQLRRIPEAQLSAEEHREWAEGLRTIENTRIATLDEVPYAARSHFATQDGVGTMVHLQVRESDDGGTGLLVRFAAEAEEVRRALAAASIDAPLLSENWIAGEVFARVEGDGKFLLLGTLLAVFLILCLDFRKPWVALGVLSSVMLGVLMIALGMWLTRVQLNFMNMAILPVCLGISLDNAIHVYHRWKEGGRGSIPLVLGHTMAANALASATNLLGFAALALTQHPGLRSVAYLAMIGVTATYVSTTLWLPLVLAWVDQRAEGSASGLNAKR